LAIVKEALRDNRLQVLETIATVLIKLIEIAGEPSFKSHGGASKQNLVKIMLIDKISATSNSNCTVSIQAEAPIWQVFDSLVVLVVIVWLCGW